MGIAFKDGTTKEAVAKYLRLDRFQNPVDARTGSKYALDDDKRPIPNESRLSTMKTLMEDEKFINKLIEIDKIHTDVKYGHDRDTVLMKKMTEMKTKFEIDDDALLRAVVYLNTHHVSVRELIFAEKSSRED